MRRRVAEAGVEKALCRHESSQGGAKRDGDARREFRVQGREAPQAQCGHSLIVGHEVDIGASLGWLRDLSVSPRFQLWCVQQTSVLESALVLARSKAHKCVCFSVCVCVCLSVCVCARACSGVCGGKAERESNS